MSMRKTLQRGVAAALSAMLLGISLSELPKPLSAAAAATTLTVGAGGTYKTVTEAVNAAASINPQSENDRVTIAIAPGTYREQIIINTPYLSFTNSNPGGGDVLLTWYYGIGYQYYSADASGYYNASNAAAKSEKNIASRWGTSVRINSNAKYFRAENIVFENSFNRYMTSEEIADGVEPTGETLTVQRTMDLDVQAKSNTERAAACCVEADFAEFYNCEFLSSQDTLYTATRAYFKECKIQGNTDYIFGGGDIVFDECELCFGGYSDKAVGGYITAAREQTLGYLFWNCTVTANPDLTVGAGYFGRPWRDTAHVLFYNTKLQYEGIITGVGWNSMSGVDPSQATFREYNTTTVNGGSVNTDSRTSDTVLSSCDATRETYLQGWTPYYYNYTAQPIVVSGTAIAEISVNDRENGYDWHIAQNLAVGSTVFGDRDFTYTAVPDALLGAEYVQTACDSKNFSGELGTLTAGNSITLYVAYDTRLGSAPTWLSDWENTDMTLSTSNDVTFAVCAKTVAAGEQITLGDNTTGSGVIGYTIFAQSKPIVYNGTLIQSLNMIDRANGANWGITQNIAVGTTVFGDRDFTFTAVPDALIGAEYIQTACDSKLVTGNLATAVAAEDIMLYVGVDARIAAPAWLNGWENTGLTMTTSNDVTFIVYAKQFARGEEITLGANDGGSTCINYVAAATLVPVETTTTTTTTTSTTTTTVTATLRGDVNCDGYVKINDVILLNRMISEDTAAVITEQGMRNAECDDSDRVDSNDSVAILKILANLE